MEDASVVHGVRVLTILVLYTGCECGGCWCFTRGESVEDAGVVHEVRVWRMPVLYTG